MNVNQLHRRLALLIADGHGRKSVRVYKPSFVHPLENDGVVYLDIIGAHAMGISLLDDDGGIALDTRGRERHKAIVALFGDAACSHGEVDTCEICGVVK